MTCPKSIPSDDPQWKNSLVRCTITGYHCAFGYSSDGDCSSINKTPRQMAAELR